MPQISNHASALQEAVSVRYNNAVYELKRSGQDIIVLSLGEAFFELPPVSLDGLPHPEGLHYSHSRGVPELRERVALYYRKTYGVNVDPDNEILFTSGSKAAIYFSMMAVLNPGDDVLIPEPMWVSYPEQARLCLANPITIPFPSKISDFERYLTDKTRLLIINNPNNPTGYVYSKRELQYLADLARANDIYLLSDEAYSDFLVNDEFVSAGRLDNTKSHTIVCNSISKNLGISGWRIGYAISNSQLIHQLLKINQHVITCPATNLQHYLVQNFDSLIQTTSPQITHVVKKRAVVAEYLQSQSLEYVTGTAGFYLFVSIAPSLMDSERFALRLLHEHQVCAVPGIGYGPSCDKFIRLSVGSEPLERIYRGIDAIKRLIAETCHA
ncbi:MULTISPECIES: pyridoxal phosphate-dependent aminotransferase [Achromobacter]|uniref:Aminotransferase n=1 Tax=Achromobacter piechaudii TaxID=72556 RepID=A0A6S7ESH7_9BURK|nr:MULTISPECIES: pyridoxal phosphate-dependent aminotransferase [Achromobacter]CAB3920858.1 Aspartate/prephenate aminotransferase [Achromobacter piechaudii]